MGFAMPAWGRASAINHWVATSPVGWYFRLDGSDHPKAIKNARFLTDLRAGITTFATMAYIISVNASIISDSGGTCVCNDTKDPTCANDAAYNSCLVDLRKDLITATTAISCLASVMFGFLTNLPVAMAPGMGMNAYFTYTAVGYHGTGGVPYRLALTAVFISGLIFFTISLIGMRQWLVKLVPSSLKIGANAGIGLFLTLIGLGPAGIAVVSGASDTPLTLAGCRAKYRDEFGQCTGHELEDPTLWIGIFLGGFIPALLLLYRVKSALIVGIALVCIVTWPRGTNFTYFPHTPAGNESFNYFKKVVDFHPIKSTLAAQEWNLKGANKQFVVALFTFLYIDVLDCTGTLFTMARFAGVVDEKTGDFPRSTLAYCTDAMAVTIGSLFGVAPATCFIESGAGISEGGRTGLTAMTTGMCFFASLFFAPITASIPSYATGCTLILVGFLMARSVVDINWNYAGDAIPAFVTLLMMPFTYSIAYGLIAGLLSYTVLNGATAIITRLSGGKLLPVDEDLREYWTWRRDYGAPMWFVRCARNKGRFWDREQNTHHHQSDVDALDMSLYRRESNSEHHSHFSVSELVDRKE